jgi:hypothetical protein
MLRHQLLCILVLVLVGCDATDPYLRQGTWHPNDANETNLRAMVVSPSDLVRGVSSSEGDGRQAAAAPDRLRNDKPRLLPDSAIAKVVPINSGSQGAP